MIATTKIPAPEPGIYEGISFETYASWDAVNWHSLSNGLSPGSMMHVKAALDGKLKDDDSKDRKFGRAQHCLLLEGEQSFRQRFNVATRCVGVQKSGKICGKNSSVMSPVPRRLEDFQSQATHVLGQCGFELTGAAYESLRYTNCKSEVELRFDSPLNVFDQICAGGVNLNSTKPLQFWYCKTHQPEGSIEPADYISETQQEDMFASAEALKRHRAVKILRNSGGHEVSIVAEMDGVLCKARLDKLILNGRPTIVDLKKCSKGGADRDEFSRSIAKYKYHGQASFYCDIAKAQTGKDFGFIWCAIEEKYPHAIGVWYADDESLEIGRAQYRMLLSNVRNCIKMGDWPDYTPIRLQEIGLPAWYAKQNEGLLEAMSQ